MFWIDVWIEIFVIKLEGRKESRARINTSFSVAAGERYNGYANSAKKMACLILW